MLQIRRLRPDWIVKTYVIPIARLDINEKFWAEARKLKDAWNEAAATYRSWDTQVLALQEKLVQLNNEKLNVDAPRNALKTLRRDRKNKTRETLKTFSPKLFTNDLESLSIALESAMDLAFRDGGTLHFKSGIQSANFTKRFKRGGVAFDDLFTNLDLESQNLRRKPLVFRAAARRESRRSQNKTLLHCRYLVGKSRIPVKFTGVWSYPAFACKVFVKRAILVGKFSAARLWQWRLILNIEEPPSKIPPVPSSPAAAIDLGYRRFPEYIRYGFVVDTAGNKFELRLPTGNMISAYLKSTIRFLKKKGLEKDYVKDLNDYADWDAQKGTNLQQAKDALSELFAASRKNQIEMPTSWDEAFASMERIRGQGLKRLRLNFGEILDTANDVNTEVLTTLRRFIEIVDRWSVKDAYFETEQEHFRRKFFGRRRLLYRQTVKWLADNYSALFWKESLKLARLAIRTKQASRATQPALRESNKYRHWTSLHLFRVFVRETSRERPGWLRPPVDNDQLPLVECDRCGAPITSAPSDLMLTCEHGHSRDRDERSAYGLLPDLPVADVDTPISIPKHLKECIVRIK